MRFGDSPFAAGGEDGESRIALSEAGAERLLRGETEEPTTGSAAMIKRSVSGSASLCNCRRFDFDRIQPVHPKDQ